MSVATRFIDDRSTQITTSAYSTSSTSHRRGGRATHFFIHCLAQVAHVEDVSSGRASAPQRERGARGTPNREKSIINDSNVNDELPLGATPPLRPTNSWDDSARA